MIYCKISDLSKYSYYSLNMKKAIEYILSQDLKALPLGKTIIEGEAIYLNKTNAKTMLAELLNYEVHRKYIDIQIDLDGDELIYIKNDSCEIKQEYITNGDYALYNFCEPNLKFNLNKEMCAIIFPNEMHIPCIKCTSEKVLKCVVKVLEK